MNEDDVIIETDGSEELNSEVKDRSGKLKSEIESLRAEKQEYLDGWQRAKADYVNALKRFDEEKKGAVGLGKALAAVAFLPAMDSLERAEASGEVPESFKGIAKQLHDAAATLGLEKIGAVGETFDPNHHEALGQDAVEDASKDNTVTVVLETGWKSRESVLRAAKVRVGQFG